MTKKIVYAKGESLCMFRLARFSRIALCPTPTSTSISISREKALENRSLKERQGRLCVKEKKRVNNKSFIFSFFLRHMKFQ